MGAPQNNTKGEYSKDVVETDWNIWFSPGVSVWLKCSRNFTIAGVKLAWHVDATTFSNPLQTVALLASTPGQQHVRIAEEDIPEKYEYTNIPDNKLTEVDHSKAFITPRDFSWTYHFRGGIDKFLRERKAISLRERQATFPPTQQISTQIISTEENGGNSQGRQAGGSSGSGANTNSDSESELHAVANRGSSTSRKASTDPENRSGSDGRGL